MTLFSIINFNLKQKKTITFTVNFQPRVHEKIVYMCVSMSVHKYLETKQNAERNLRFHYNEEN